MNLSRIDRVYAHIPVTATLADGDTATVTGADVAIVRHRGAPTGATTWTPTAYAAGTAVVLLAGPDADPTAALPVPAGRSDLWLRITDTPEVQAVKVATLSCTS